MIQWDGHIVCNGVLKKIRWDSNFLLIFILFGDLAGPHISNSAIQNLPHSWVRDSRIPSLCTNHPATSAAPGAPHIQPCQVHANVFPQPFAQTCHYTGFNTTPQLTQIQPQSHQTTHYHMQQVCSYHSY